MRNSSPKPSMRFSSTRSNASGVTSRPVTPVPPLVITTSICGSAIQVRSCRSIAPASSFSIARAASRCPALVIRSTSASPDVSFAGVRVSETVSTAMLTGMNARLSSMRAMMLPPDAPPSVHARRGPRQIALCSERREVREFTRGNLVEAWRGQPQSGRIDPSVGQHMLDEGARLVVRDRLDEQQRIVLVAHGAAPAQKAARSRIVAGEQPDQIPLDAVLTSEVRNVTLAHIQIERRIMELGIVQRV